MDQESKEVITSKGLQTDERGSLALYSLNDQMAFAKKLIDEKMVSSTFKTPQQVVIGFQYAKALKLNEMIGLRMMYVVNGRPCLYGEGPLSLVQRSGLLESIREYYVDGDMNVISVANKNLKAEVYASITQLRRKGDVETQEDFFSIDELNEAKLDVDSYGKPKDVWVKWLKIMMRYKARTMGLKSKFADVIAGIPIAEYDYDFSPEVPIVPKEVKSSVVEDLDKAYPSTDENPESKDPSADQGTAVPDLREGE